LNTKTFLWEYFLECFEGHCIVSSCTMCGASLVHVVTEERQTPFWTIFLFCWPRISV